MGHRKMVLRVLGAVGIFFVFTGLSLCDDNALDCALNGDNVKGRVTFTSGVPVRKGTAIVIETTSGSPSRKSVIVNAQGLISVPYSLCVANDVDYQLRAYQDNDGDQTGDSGEGVGLYDGTENGNGTNLTVNVPNLSNEWSVKSGVNISLDTTI